MLELLPLMIILITASLSLNTKKAMVACWKCVRWVVRDRGLQRARWFSLAGHDVFVAVFASSLREKWVPAHQWLCPIHSIWDYLPSEGWSLMKWFLPRYRFPTRLFISCMTTKFAKHVGPPNMHSTLLTWILSLSSPAQSASWNDPSLQSLALFRNITILWIVFSVTYVGYQPY